ncbi:uncharacterized protein DDB_G0290685-like [Leguminivora glycinivorella]|uniref:uncharacterized protein DDB_G0290685-like n=1 Tax=Leguminivora glycinivorella TaxID=1035111 RepID=UPI00200F8E0E|nr:uncharacterized protein DDB_G0290685-like [Leguminivora glycinivorella]
MIKFLYFLSVIALYIVKDIECSSINDELRSYYDSDIQQQFKNEWKKYRVAFENEIATNLQENFGTKALNIFEPDRHVTHFLAGGFHLTDGVVMVYFFEMVLRELPALIGPKLTINLPSNYIQVHSKVDRMFIDTTYYVARNSSTVIYASPDDQKELSPFSLQQVDNMGKVVIVAEDCTLNGISIATLSGDSVNVGHCTYQLTECKFSVEISTPNSGAPPVIAPYFPRGPKEKLEIVISKPFREELQIKLQGAMNSYINTSVLLGSQGPNIRNNQHKLFKSYSDFMTDYVHKINQNTLKSNKGHVNLPNYEILMNTETDKRKWSCHMALVDVMMYGLDTAYVARSGGPFNSGSPTSAADAIMFSSIQIRGKITHDDGKGSLKYDFAAELTDITMDIVIYIEDGKTKIRTLTMSGWRSLEFSIIPWETQYKERHGYQSLVYGHILNEIPARITKHLSSILGEPMDRNEQVGDNNDDDGGGGGGNKDDDGDNDGNDEEGRDDNGSVDDNDENASDTAKDRKLKSNDSKEFFDDNFFSDEFFSDDFIEDNFFSDDNSKKDFFSEFESDGKKDNAEGIKDKTTGQSGENGVDDGDDVAVNDAGDDGGVKDGDDGNKDKPVNTDQGVDDDDAVADSKGNEGVDDDDAVADNEDDVGVDDTVDKDGADAGASEESNKGVDDETNEGNNPEAVNGSGGWPVSDDANDEGSVTGSEKNVLGGSQLKNVKGDGFFSDDFIEKDFFSDDHIKDDFFSDMTAENNKNEGKGTDTGTGNEAKDRAEAEVKDEDEGATENVDEGVIQDGEAVENDDGKQINDDVTVDGPNNDDTKNKDFFSDDHLEKDFFSDDHIEDNFFSDDFIEKDFFSDDDTKERDNGDAGSKSKLKSVNGDGGWPVSDTVSDNNGNMGSKSKLDSVNGDGGWPVSDTVSDNDGNVGGKSKLDSVNGDGGWPVSDTVSDNDGNVGNKAKLSSVNGDGGWPVSDAVSDNDGNVGGKSKLDSVNGDGGWPVSDAVSDNDGNVGGKSKLDSVNGDGGWPVSDAVSDNDGNVGGKSKLDSVNGDGGWPVSDTVSDNDGNVGNKAKLSSVNGDGGWPVSDAVSDNDGNVGGKSKLKSVNGDGGWPVEDNVEVADNDEQNVNGKNAKKLWVFGSEDDKPFFDENFFSDDNFERRSLGNDTKINDLKNQTDATAIEDDEKKTGNHAKGEVSSEDIKVVPPNVHNTRRQQNVRMSENEIR